jgi:hypothetical protein
MTTTMMMTTMRKTSRLVVGAVLLFFAVAVAAAQKSGQPYALIVGTVFFEDSGRLVRGAKVEVKQKEGRKRWESSTNMEGEFTFRLPAGKAVYIVEARAEGRAPDRKEVEITGEERVDVVLHLKAR